MPPLLIEFDHRRNGETWHSTSVEYRVTYQLYQTAVQVSESDRLDGNSLDETPNAQVPAHFTAPTPQIQFGDRPDHAVTNQTPALLLIGKNFWLLQASFAGGHGRCTGTPPIT
ncbi:hypothetical protein ACFWPH_24850 [Nocardia sp. NPDC058499]|uniref:hypothetical protein n=1 Tax=Nocardia sp. NPDC058499 TaxID=3346530 RepID=UPI00365526EB